jgi:hypothetical protein
MRARRPRSLECVVHLAPPSDHVPGLMKDLLAWVKRTDTHPLVASCVFTLRTGVHPPICRRQRPHERLWQTRILSHWNPLYAFLPVETIIRDRQTEYYRVLGACDKLGNSTALSNSCSPLFSLRSVKSLQPTKSADQVKSLLKLLKSKPLSAMECMTRLNLSHRPTFRANYLSPVLSKHSEVSKKVTTSPNTCPTSHSSSTYESHRLTTLP